MIIVMNKPAGSVGESLAQTLPRGSSVVAKWLSGTDPVALQIQNTLDGYDPVLDSVGAAVTLTPTAPQYTLTAAGNYRVTAGSTSAIIVSVNPSS